MLQSNMEIQFTLALILLVLILIYLFFKLNKSKNEIAKLNMFLEDKNSELDLFKTIIDKVDVGITITNPYDKNKAIYINEKFEEITGYKKEETIGRNLKFLQNGHHDDRAINTIQNAIENTEPCIVELTNYKKDGTKYQNLLSISPIFDEQNKLTCYIGIQYDITHLKHHNHILAQREKLDSMKDLLQNIAHQWRQPLSVISVNATGMKIKQEFGILDEETIIEICTSINENTQYLSQIIEDFTSVVTTGNTKNGNYNEKNNTSKFIDHIDKNVTDYNINLILDLNETATIKGYSDELIECFINIFNNSKDALIKNQDENNRYLFISQKIDKDKLIIEFKDNGGGIDETIMPKIFEPYFTTKHKNQGTGLGLHIVYNLITSHLGGAIEVHNEIFELLGNSFTGAVFKITLPLK